MTHFDFTTFDQTTLRLKQERGESSMPAMFRNVRVASLLAVLALGFCGCGGAGRVSGTVTKDGQPVRSGVITFVSRDGKGTALASIKKDGTYTAANVPVGETSVILVNAMEEPDFTGPVTVSDAAKPSGKRAPPPKAPIAIPDKYGKPETSGLTLTVRSGDNPYDIDVGR
jgi:hypothetical protein